MTEMVFNYRKKDAPVILKMGEENGEGSFSVTSRFLMKDGEPWLPVMGEFHFTRYDRDEWETELLKIKAAGIDIVSSYLFWIFYEEKEGNFRFDGCRDIAYFLSLCKKHGLYVFVRIGPWCHGECRNGGFPDWLQYSGIKLRTNDEAYLKYVHRLFSAYSKEISPYLFGNGGTVIGIQLENELTDNGGHLRRLKEIALSCGLHAPYYTFTGWGPRVAEFPEGEMLPVFGCYPDAPWDGQTVALGVNKNYFFSGVRNDSSIGSDRISGKASEDESVLDNLPHMTCELGPGNQLTYHRRPIITQEDVLSLATVSLGSGNCLPGYYMFHGGFNPTGGLYQESKASGYSNDLPVSSYDFQAPLDEYGQPRESYFYYKRLHQFIHCVGKELAVMTCTPPDILPDGLSDRHTPRVYFRGDENSGFLFYNTHQRNYPISGIENLTVRVNYSDKDKKSYGPFDVRAGVSGIIPLRFSIGEHIIEFTTLMPLFKDDSTLVLAMQEGTEPVIEIKGKVHISDCEGIEITRKNDSTFISFSDNGKSVSFLLDGISVTVLSVKDSLRFYPMDNKFYFSDGIVFSLDNKVLSYGEHTAEFPSDAVTLERADKNRIASESIYAPYLFADAEKCPEYILKVSPILADSFFDAVIELSVSADVVQLYADQLLIADDFLKDESFRVSLRRILPYIRKGRELRIKCAPIPENRDVYLETAVSDVYRAPEIKKIRCFDVRAI